MLQRAHRTDGLRQLRVTTLVLVALFLMACSGTARPEGAGTVKFGSDLNQQTLALIGPEKTTFTQSDQLAYVATLAEPANAASLRLVISKLNGTAETTLVDQPIPIANPDFQVLGNKFSLADLMPVLNGSGTYVMRVLRDSTLLAQGAFNIV